MGEAALDSTVLPSLVGVVLRLLGVLALVVGGGWAWMRWRRQAGGTEGGLRVLDRALVSRGASVVLIRVAERRILLGVSPEGVRLITELDADSETREPEFDRVLTATTERRQAAG
ncbi:MAG: hypothetical protein GY716_08535 [bacterium]|nr:hypothetical protein [bacterium]